MKIKTYTSVYEKSWLECRVLAFLDTAYYNNVLREKEQYKNPAIELVTIRDGRVIGLIDVEYEQNPNTVCSGIKR